LHKTKGLEWPTVYLVGLEDDSLPGHWCEADEIPDDALRRLTTLARDLASQGLLVEFEVRRGDAVQELAGEAAEPRHVGATRISFRCEPPALDR